MPDNNSNNEEDQQLSRAARAEVQLIVGQIHGLVWQAVSEVDFWYEEHVYEEEEDRNEPPPDEPGIAPEDIRKAGNEIHNHFGMVQAAFNSGVYDKTLVKVGLAGAQFQVKKKGFLSAISRFFKRNARDFKSYVSRLRGGLRWSSTLMGSITAALQEEIERLPGAATAGEAIKELIEVLQNATEPNEQTLVAPQTESDPNKKEE